MLSRIHIRGFKSLADVEVDLGRFNVFVGANGSGKSALLEAIGLLGCAASGKVDDEAFGRRGVRPGLPALYKTAFKTKPIRRVISLSAESDGAFYDVSLDNPITRPEGAWRFTNENVKRGQKTVASRSPRGGSLHLDGVARRLTELAPSSGLVPLLRVGLPEGPARQLLDDLESFAIYTPFTPMLRGTTPDVTQRSPVGLLGGRLADGILEVIKLAHEKQGLMGEVRRLVSMVEWVDTVQVGTAVQAQLSPAVASPQRVLRFRDRFMVDERNWLSAFDASEGALYVTFMILLALHPGSPSVLGIDNVDQAMHPRLARRLIGEVQELILADDSRPQMLLTTHNPLVLDSLRLKDDRVRLFTVDRTRGGASVVTRVPYGDALAKAEKQGMTLSRLWLAGHLGGVPNL